MKVTDIPVAVDAFLTHNTSGCTGAWQVSKISHPTSPRIARIVLSCDSCAAGHLYDVEKLPDVSDGLPRPSLAVVR